MPNDLLTVTVDAAAVLEAIARLGDRAGVPLKQASRVSADSIAHEAHARVRRRTGVTAAMIHVEETHDGQGWIVLPWDADFEGRLRDSGNNDDLNYAIPRWLEFGTYKMIAYPYLFNSARLEEGPHLRRIAEALQAAIDDSGLGD